MVTFEVCWHIDIYIYTYIYIYPTLSNLPIYSCSNSAIFYPNLVSQLIRGITALRWCQLCEYLGIPIITHMEVSENSGTAQTSILMGCSININPFWDTPIYGNPYIWVTKHINHGLKLLELNASIMQAMFHSGRFTKALRQF